MASRTFFASQAVGLMVGANSTIIGSGAAFSPTSYPVSALTPANQSAHIRLDGVQSVGLSTSIDFNQIFELGYLQIFENIEGIPTCEVTIERNIPNNGYTMYQIAAKNNGTTSYRGKYVNDLLNFGSNNQLAVRLAVNTFAQEVNGNNFAFCQIIHVEGFTSSYSVNATTDGPVSESMTVIGTSVSILPSGNQNLVLVPSGGEGVIKTAYRGRDCSFRTAIVSGTAPTFEEEDRVQSFSLSVDVGREDLQELGRKQPYLRYANFPTEVTCDVEYNLDLGKKEDQNQVHTLSNMFQAFTDDDNCDINPASGYVVMLSGARVDCDSEGVEQPAGQTLICATSGAKLTSQSYTGGDTGGGPVTVSESYQAFNNMIAYVTH